MIVTWKSHVDGSTASRYGINIGRDPRTKLVTDLNISTNTIECDKGPYQRCKTPMGNLNDFNFKPINIKIRPFSEDSFPNAYINEFHES